MTVPRARAVAITLASLGLFALLTYTVTRRTREIGIRVVLGARDADVCRLVLNQVLTFVVIGIGRRVGRVPRGYGDAVRRVLG